MRALNHFSSRENSLAFFRVAILLFTLLFFAPAFAQAPKQALRIGVLVSRGADAPDWSSTFKHLTASLPGYRVEVITGSAAFLTQAVASHRLDFLITNPGHYFELQVSYGARALATEQKLDGPPPGQAIGATIIAASTRHEISALADARTSRIAATAPDAFSYRIAAFEMMDRAPSERAMSPVFVGYPAFSVIEALRSGAADVGVLRSCALEKFIEEGQVKAGEFSVVGRRASGVLNCAVSTRLYPGWPFVKVAQTSENLAREIQTALLAMQPGADETIWAKPESYQGAQPVYRTLKEGPYASFSRLGLVEILAEYWVIAALAAMGAIWWIVHVARVSYLVRRRTRELQEAHEAARIHSERMEHVHRLSLMGEMATSLAHEINQPLAAILTYARGCARRLDAGADPAAIRDAVERIAAQAERAGDIVRGMREFARKNPSEQTPIAAATPLRNALTLFEPTAASANAHIHADIPDSLPIVRADKTQIEEIILNLLQNALEATGAQADKRIWLVARHEGEVVRVSVRDNGPGVSPDVREKLFEPFFTTKENGLGLGLSLSRTIIEAHGGRLEFDTSGLDARGLETSVAGAAFRFYLPALREEERA